MGGLSLADIRITPLTRITTSGGDVMHAMKAGDPGYEGFGEAYFSWVERGAVKAWKRHFRMTMNLVVPVGCVRIVFALAPEGPFRAIKIGTQAEYARLSVPPGIWFGFQGCATGPSLLLNLANVVHDPEEAQRAELKEFDFDWN
jgi:dTDP-4-dehydrorhamnose 3,5-epimerase